MVGRRGRRIFNWETKGRPTGEKITRSRWCFFTQFIINHLKWQFEDGSNNLILLRSRVCYPQSVSTLSPLVIRKMSLGNPFFARKSCFSDVFYQSSGSPTNVPCWASGRHCGCGKRRLSNSHLATLNRGVGGYLSTFGRRKRNMYQKPKPAQCFHVSKVTLFKDLDGKKWEVLKTSKGKVAVRPTYFPTCPSCNLLGRAYLASFQGPQVAIWAKPPATEVGKEGT